MFCKKCGAYMNDNQRYCSQCGAVIIGEEGNVSRWPDGQYDANTCVRYIGVELFMFILFKHSRHSLFDNRALQGKQGCRHYREHKQKGKHRPQACDCRSYRGNNHNSFVCSIHCNHDPHDDWLDSDIA